MDANFKDQEKRIESVFSKKIEDFSRRTETLEIYKSFLDKNLNFPVELTGIEDFNWEEFYVLGPGSAKEYEELKKTKPSYTDIFNMNHIENSLDEHYGLFAQVTRLTDKKQFQIPLVDLKAVDVKSKNYQLLDDYSVWCVNY